MCQSMKSFKISTSRVSEGLRVETLLGPRRVFWFEMLSEPANGTAFWAVSAPHRATDFSRTNEC